MPILHSSGVITPGQLGPIEPAVAVTQDLGHADHIEHRNTFGDRDDRLDAGIDRFEDRVGGECGRDEDHRGRRAGLRDRLLDRIEDRQRDRRRAAFARRHATDHLRAVLQATFGVELPGVAGDPLANDPRLFVDEDTHDRFC